MSRAVTVIGGPSVLRQAISVGPHHLIADRKKWPLKEIRVALTHSKNYANDCVNCEQPAAKLDRIDRRITLIGELSAEQRRRLLEIANLCPVHKSLTSGIDIQTELVNPSL